MDEPQPLLSSETRVDKPSWLWARWVFLRIMALGFITGFMSLSGQIQGLIGPHGILPAADYLSALRQTRPLWACFLEVPSLLWWNAGSQALTWLCVTGTLAGLLWFFNVLPRMMIFICWACYLSFVSAARNFSGFQSDGLMLETALLAFFCAPAGFRPGLGEDSPPSRFSLLMLNWLLFRLMFESGLVKFLGGDRSWRDGTAMDHYYENCPFPTWIGYYAQHLPAAVHKVTSWFTLGLELAAPFLIFMGQRPRRLLFFFWTVFQTGILLTANYTFLNFTAIALGMFLLDDVFFKKQLRLFVPPLPENRRRFQTGRVFSGAILGYVFYVTLIYFLGLFLPRQKMPRALAVPVSVTDAFRSANRYGLFGSMTDRRDEVFFEGSNDWGQTWKRYEFKWQPQELNRKPRFMAPHLPRFDWNLWFAALGDFRQYSFVVMAGVRLIEGEPSVIKLFARNPFPEKPPQMIRFPLERYRFTDLKTFHQTGNYWTREEAGYYAPFLIRNPETEKLTLIAMDAVPEGFRQPAA